MWRLHRMQLIGDRSHTLTCFGGRGACRPSPGDLRRAQHSASCGHGRSSICSLLLPAGDPFNETNWGWFEDQKKVRTGIRLRLGLGGTDDADGLEENHDEFVEVSCCYLGQRIHTDVVLALRRMF